MNRPVSLTKQAHYSIRQYLFAGEYAVDATVGNGHDTLFLSQQVGVDGRLFGFDIQQHAIQSAQLTLEGKQPNTLLFQVSHCQMDEYIPLQYHGKIKAIMFNLGYLPGSDKTVITQADSTLIALGKSIDLLAAGGIITVIAYPGHCGGELEALQIRQWTKTLDNEKYLIQCINSSEKQTSPQLFIVKKR